MSDLETQIEPTAENLVQQVDAKLRLLETLMDKGNMQLEMIEKGDTNALLQLLAEKQSLIRELAATQDIISKLQDPASQATISWSDPAQRAACQTSAQQCNRLGKQLLDLEATCEQAARARRDAMAQQIEEFSGFDSRNSNSIDSDDENRLASFDESS